jgi:outer membrane protein TolC
MPRSGCGCAHPWGVRYVITTFIWGSTAPPLRPIRGPLLAVGVAAWLLADLALAADDVSVPPMPGTSRPTHSTPAQPVTRPGPPISQASVTPEGQPIDLASALRLAGVQNLSLVIAEQRVEYAVAIQQLAAAQILPTLNLGGSYDSHTGEVQQDAGNMLSLNRGAMYVGAGANAVSSGVPTVPGLAYDLNLSQAIFGYLVTRQGSRQARFERAAINNAVLQDVALAYTDLLRTAGLRSLAVLARNDTGEVARLTADYARTGEGRPADANRAATEFARRDEELLEAQAAAAQASHALTELLNLDPLLRLVPVESQLVPEPIVPTQMPLPELLTVAALNRPELLARRTAIRAALLQLNNARLLPFSPTVLMGLSGGAFGGGSSVGESEGQPRFGEIASRIDFNVALYWSLQNLGVGNLALIDAARSRLRQSEFDELSVLDSVRNEVVTAYVRALSWLAQVNWQAQAVRAGERASKEDLIRVRGRAGLPIELLDSLRQVIDARRDYLNAIIEYNRAEVRLYVALGNPPADMLARPVPDELLAPPDQTLDAQLRNIRR